MGLTEHRYPLASVRRAGPDEDHVRCPGCGLHSFFRPDGPCENPECPTNEEETR